jgi:uncharacterized protein Yka (UPF0111/DUF47 family)
VSHAEPGEHADIDLDHSTFRSTVAVLCNTSPKTPRVDRAMASKSQIVAELGASDLLLPERIAQSLVANDRIKYYLALLQTARANADRPMAPVQTLRSERLASRIEEAWLDDVVAGAQKRAGGRYAIPQADQIVARIDHAVGLMIACLPDEPRRQFEDRISHLQSASADAEIIAGAAIDRMTSGSRAAGDSLHLVVMDAHHAINALQATTATESVGGAKTHNLSGRGRRLVEAFMAGLNRTAPLKFDHPGLGTTATEHDGRILIQNDIGTTDAHVLVLRIDGLAAALTYTDIHERRLKFFESLFSSFAVSWEKASMRSSESLETKSYILATGTYTPASEADLARYLEHLGSRIVFLIDWNRMRKRLRQFVDQQSAIRVLRWAAEHDFGHRGLIEIGGERVLAEAVEYAAGENLHYGDRLDSLIGAEAAETFLKRAMELAATGLLQGRSRRIIADEIKADLRHHFEASRLTVFAIAARHAALGFDIAAALRDALEEIGQPSVSQALLRLAERAADWESRADGLLNSARDDIKRFKRPVPLQQFFESADDAVDELEEAAALIELTGLAPAPATVFPALRQLGDVALACSQELVKAIECAATITRTDVRDDLDDFLKSLDQLMRLEHQADAIMRKARRALVTEVDNARALYLVDQIARALEQATDAYAHAGQSLRTYLMEEVLS